MCDSKSCHLEICHTFCRKTESIKKKTDYFNIRQVNRSVCSCLNLNFIKI